MTGALLKKEFLQIRKMYTTNKRKNKQGGKGMLIFLIIMYFFMMLAMGALDSAFAFSMLPAGQGWLYYFFITVLAFIFGVFGSVFTTAEMLFRAKDNEFLMAMPIPPSKIIFVRMVGVYFMGFIYELLVMLPGVIIYFMFSGITILTLLFGILGIILLGFVILAFSCFFGWIVAIITAKLKNKNILTVIISIVFIGFFIYFRFVANSFFRNIIENAAAIGDVLQGWGYPLYSLGLGMDGNVIGMLVFAAIAGVLFGLTYFLISRSFNKIINIKPSEKKARFKTEQIRTSGVDKALFRKEVRRLTSSPNYMLNCAFGVLLLVAGAIVVLIMAASIRDLIENFSSSIYYGRELALVVMAFVVCMIAGLNDISAPSISLEGPYIWVLQTMPVTPMQVFLAKFKLAVFITGIPAVICAVVVEAVLGAGVAVIILGALLAAVYSVFTSFLGIRMDLARPFLDWTNETQAVKQSMSALFTLLIGMISPLVSGGLYLMFGLFVGPEIYLAVWILIYAALAFILFNWLRRRGSVKFALLGQ